MQLYLWLSVCPEVQLRAHWHCCPCSRHPPSPLPHPAPVSTRFTKIQNTKMTMKRDGISSLQYRLVEVSRQPMYTNITVEIGRPPPRLARG